MNLEERIYEKLRNHSKSYTSKSFDQTDQEIRKGRTHGEYLEQLTDFTTNEIKELLLEEQVARRFLGKIGQGKEANVYWIENAHRKNKIKFVAVKMFRIHTTSHNFRSLHTRSKLSDTAKLGIATNLCHNEYMKLHHLYESGLRAPKPVFRYGFIYGMEFLGKNISLLHF